MLESALSLPPAYRNVFTLFRDKGKSQAFRDKLEASSLETHVLEHDAPHLRAMVRDVGCLLRDTSADLLLANGYKASLVGLIAARQVDIPVVAISRGWTRETWKVRAYEALDRVCLRRMDRVVCVSEAQAVKVRRAGVIPERVVVIRNAIRTERFASPDPSARGELRGLFPEPPERIVGAAGRLSPEKGFEVLVEAAAITIRSHPEIGFIHFGAGPLRERLRLRINELGLANRFILAGFRADLDRLIPAWDLAVLPSYTEGLPNIALEAFAAAVPVVGTAVGGTPEVINQGVSGYLVPPGDPQALARGIQDALKSEDHRRCLGEAGRELVRENFGFAGQVREFLRLFDDLNRHGNTWTRS